MNDKYNKLLETVELMKKDITLLKLYSSYLADIINDNIDNIDVTDINDKYDDIIGVLHQKNSQDKNK